VRAPKYDVLYIKNIAKKLHMAAALRIQPRIIRIQTCIWPRQNGRCYGIGVWRMPKPSFTEVHNERGASSHHCMSLKDD